MNALHWIVDHPGFLVAATVFSTFTLHNLTRLAVAIRTGTDSEKRL